MRTSLTPAASSTARTGPPAITPVPGAAGRKRTLPAPQRPMISCGSVPFWIGTFTMFLRACSNDFRIASATSFAFASAIPTFPFWSPTETRAEKENLLPPFTTFATRLIKMTFSTRSLSRFLFDFFFLESLGIRTSDLPHGHPRQKPSPDHGICIHRDRKPRCLFPASWRAQPAIFQLHAHAQLVDSCSLR